MKTFPEDNLVRGELRLTALTHAIDCDLDEDCTCKENHMTSCYNKPGDRYIVTFEIGYAHSEEFGATSVEEAAALGTVLVADGAVCSVLDRETGAVRELEPHEFAEALKRVLGES